MHIMAFNRAFRRSKDLKASYLEPSAARAKKDLKGSFSEAEMSLRQRVSWEMLAFLVPFVGFA